MACCVAALVCIKRPRLWSGCNMCTQRQFHVQQDIATCDSWAYTCAGGRNLLHWAVLGNQAATVAFLLNKGAWVEASDAHDDTPLHLAARYAYNMRLNKYGEATSLPTWTFEGFCDVGPTHMLGFQTRWHRSDIAALRTSRCLQAVM